MNVIPSKKGKHVVFIETTFGKNGFATGNAKIGALEFDPSKFKTIGDAVTAAKKLNVKLVAREDSDLCDVVIQ